MYVDKNLVKSIKCCLAFCGAEHVSSTSPLQQLRGSHYRHPYLSHSVSEMGVGSKGCKRCIIVKLFGVKTKQFSLDHTSLKIKFENETP